MVDYGDRSDGYASEHEHTHSLTGSMISDPTGSVCKSEDNQNKYFVTGAWNDETKRTTSLPRTG